MKTYIIIFVHACIQAAVSQASHSSIRVGRFEEVYAWKQITYDIGGILPGKEKREVNDGLHFNEEDAGVQEWNERPAWNSQPQESQTQTPTTMNPNVTASKVKREVNDGLYFNEEDAGVQEWNKRPAWNGQPQESQTQTPTTMNPNEGAERFFIQYNNVPMGVERFGNRLFITIPRRRYGIPSTINYVDLSQTSRSPSLSPYPDLATSVSIISVYRTRADECGRLWAVDTGAIEIPNNVLYLQPPTIIVYDLNTNNLLLRYQLKSADLPSNNTATGLASITVEIRNGDCSDAYAYIPDLVSYGIITYSMKQNTSWRHSHNYFNFMPTAGDFRVGDQTFHWNDGIFSVALGQPDTEGCRSAYFHPMVSTQEFKVSSCELQKRQANQSAYIYLGDRGMNSQSTMHGFHEPTNVIFFADIGRDGISCWNTDKPLKSDNVHVLVRDDVRFSYPSDLHVTGDEVWVMSNSLPRFIYTVLDTDQYNFFVYKAKVRDLIADTACEPERSSHSASGSSLKFPRLYFRKAGNRY